MSDDGPSKRQQKKKVKSMLGDRAADLLEDDDGRDEE